MNDRLSTIQYQSIYTHQRGKWMVNGSMTLPVPKPQDPKQNNKTHKRLAMPSHDRLHILLRDYHPAKQYRDQENDAD